MTRSIFLIGSLVLTVAACDSSASSEPGEDTPLPADTVSGDPDLGQQPVDPAEITWIPIPAGSSEMGCVEGDEDCYDAETPRHEVTLAAFEMTRTEITQRQYEAVTGENPSAFSDCQDCPVEYVNWEDAKAFCEGLGGSLPSETQWEYAARGGSTTIYGCGNDSACLEEVAWFNDNAMNTTHEVALKAANGFGLYDMLGNVWEWVEECWHDDYTEDPPTDGSVWEGGDCVYRVLRGGAYGVTARGLRISNRDGDYLDGYLVPSPGFRCVK